MIPARTPVKPAQQASNEYEPDFLEKISPSAFTPLRSKHGSDSKNSSKELMYPNFLSPAPAIKKDTHHDEMGIKEEKFMSNFSISAEKNPFARSPTPNKKSIKYSASGTKIYKEDLAVPDMTNNLFSNELVDDINTKSPFSLLKRANPVKQMIQNKNREAFSNITHTLNKSQVKEEREDQKKNLESCQPKALNFEQNKASGAVAHP